MRKRFKYILRFIFILIILAIIVLVLLQFKGNDSAPKYKEILEKNKHFIALTTDEWEFYKKDYVKKLKEKYVYQILEEPIKIEKNEEIVTEKKDDYTDVISIFEKEKIEIQ